ncbi:MAG: phage terminase small subunit P27 family [Ruminococcus sp.]|nr:phage terminase small subunit P27 family [Ruminococcus sp.]
MARPAISAKTTAKHLTKSETDAKLGTEEKLKGRGDKLRPPKYLTAAQKKIFKFIVRELEGAEILGNLDVYVLTECSIALDRMQEIESRINEEPHNILNDKLLQSKDRYLKSFFRCCNELCLSPQSRAKMGNLNLQAKEENPLIKALLEDE